jgi:hypothetical protein
MRHACARAGLVAILFAWGLESDAGADFATLAAVAAAPSGVAEGAAAVSITSHTAYWANVFGIGLVDGDAAKGPGLLVIRGEIHNEARSALRHVKLGYELLDSGGRVVQSEYGYNRASEMLRAIDSPIPWNANDPPQLPIPKGGTDTFRMLFLRNETPPFQSYRVRILEADVGEEQ